MVVCFDTETTGINTKQDELLQITIVDDKFNILLDTYVCPATKTKWALAEKVNHISYDMVKNAPTAKELAPKIQEIFDSADRVVGYNVGFDIAFIKKDCDYRILSDKSYDVYKVFKEECNKKF